MGIPYHEQPLGHCYDKSIVAMNQIGGVLVHGTVTNPDGSQLRHAWIERKHEVFDTSLGRYVLLRDYYAHFKPTNMSRYTRKEVLNKLDDFKHTGPWE